MKMENYFTTLNSVNVSDKVEKKNGLTYLSWAWAWQEVKKRHQDANYKIYENESGWNYFTDGRTGWVKTGVIINGIEHIEYLPIMDYKNKSIAIDNITSFDVNKTIQRSLTKACARHGLGLYIYAGEDLPEEEQSGADSFKKDVSNAKRKSTIETKKAAEERLHTKEGALEKYNNGVAFIRKLAQIDTSNSGIMSAINDVLELLSEQGLEEERKAFDDLVNDKMPKIDDEIPY